MLPRICTSFQQGGMPGIALLGPGGSRPDLPVDDLQLSVGLAVHLFEDDPDVEGRPGYLNVDGIVGGWNEEYQCWFATYDWDALKWTPQLEANPIEFDDWIRRIFANEVVNHDWWKQDTSWNELPPLISLEYLTRLFEGSSQLLCTYTNAQVDHGLWFIVGNHLSEHALALQDLSVERPIRLRCVRSILRLFEMFAARCSANLSHLDEPGASNPLNSICYMFWDLFRIWGRPEDLDRSLLTVMVEILALPSDACRESALHGLGHWQLMYPEEVEQIVDLFIAEHPEIRPEMRRYAERARYGNVQ